MIPMSSAELTRFLIADLHRDVQRARLARDARRARRQLRHSGAQARSGQPASVVIRHAFALFGSRSPVPRNDDAAATRISPSNPRVIHRAVSLELMQTSVIAPDLPTARMPGRKQLLPGGHPNHGRGHDRAGASSAADAGPQF